MAPIRYSTSHFSKFKKYIVKHKGDSYIRISDNSHIKIVLEEEHHDQAFNIDSNDYVLFETFLNKKKIKNTRGSIDSYNINILIKDDNIEAIDYVLETKITLMDIQEIILLLYQACSTACIDIIVSFIIHTNTLEIDNTYKDYCRTCIGYIFAVRDETIISVVVEYLPDDDHAYYMSCAYFCIKENQIGSLILLGKKYSRLHTNITLFIDDAIKSGHVEILEYIISEGGNLQNTIAYNIDLVTECAKNNHIEMLEYIFTNVVFSQSQLDKFLIESYPYSIEYVDLLIDAGADFVRFGEELYEETFGFENMALATYLKEFYL